MKRRAFLLYCVAVGLLCVFSYLPLGSSAVTPIEDRFDTSDAMIQVEMNAYGSDGHRRYHTESAEVIHLHEDSLLVFERVRMRYYTDGRQTVSLRSERGTASDRTKLIELDGTVTLEQFGDDGRVQQRAVTRDVDIRTDRWIAVTEDTATLERGDLVTTGRGMIADLRQGTIELLENVRTSHEM